MELTVALGIFGILALATAWILITSLRSNQIIWDQLSSQSDGRKVLREVVDVVRRAETSSIGSYPIVTAEDYELTLYANVDADVLRERVRIFLDTNSSTVRLGIIKPSGNPLVYDTANEAVVTIGNFIVNFAEGEPMFSYFGEGYISPETMPLVQPVEIPDIRVVRVQLEIEKDASKTPVPLHVQSTAFIRNLKQN